MAVGYNPKIITDGLVLALDAGNPKNYNVGISTNWTDKVGGNNGTLVNGTYHNDGPFVGAGYVEFDGSGDYLTVADNASLDMGASDFTIEGWYFPIGNASVSTAILSKRANSSTVGGVLLYYGSTGLTPSLLVDIGGSWAINIASSVSFVSNQWNHFAIVRNGSSFKLYINGASGVSATNAGSIPDNASTFAIGAMGQDGSGAISNCYISNFRVVKGTALYTSNFTPPTKPLTAITNTKLLTCQGNTIADASSSSHTITANGDISLTKEPFAGAGAVYFDGSGDNLVISDNEEVWYFGTEDFTVECWFNRASPISLRGDLIGTYQDSVNGWGLGTRVINNGDIIWYKGNTAIVSTPSNTWSAEYWNHVAAVRSGGTTTIYLNGVALASASDSSNYNDGNPVRIGSAGNDTQYFKGFISNLRVVKGTALYTSNFTPPSRTLEPIENTVLLTCQGQNIKDYSSSAHTITPNGNVKATIVSSAFEFDGTDDYIDCGTSTDFDFGTDNYTIEAWIYINDGVQQYHGIFGSSGTGSDSLQFQLQDEKIRLSSYTAEILVSDAADVVPFRQWTHVVISRSGTGATDTKLYKNGSLIKSGQDNINWGSYGRQIGKVFSNNAYDLYGKIAQVKVYKGKGLTAAEVQQNYNATKSRYQ